MKCLAVAQVKAARAVVKERLAAFLQVKLALLDFRQVRDDAGLGAIADCKELAQATLESGV